MCRIGAQGVIIAGRHGLPVAKLAAKSEPVHLDSLRTPAWLSLGIHHPKP